MNNHKINHHLHSTGSDGELSPKEIVEKSIEKELKFICFTDHYPRPKILSWGNSFFSKDYIKEIQNLKEKYKNKIEISFGAEFCFIESNIEYIKKEIEKHNFDYVLGSVHILKTPKGSVSGVNFDEQYFLKCIDEFDGIKNLVIEYYNMIKKMTDTELFDCIAHFDLIKLFNKESILFSENEKWYKDIVIETLDYIKNKNICIEINTSGLKYPCNEQFPSFWILEEIKNRNIPITIGSDAHFIDEIDKGLDDAIKLAKKARFNYIVKFKNRKMIKIKI